MVTTRCQNLCEMIEIARLHGIEFERPMKLKMLTPTQATSQPHKKFMTFRVKGVATGLIQDAESMGRIMLASVGMDILYVTSMGSQDISTRIENNLSKYASDVISLGTSG